MKNFTKIVFEKDKYTITEIVEIVAKEFEIETRDKRGNVNQTHRTLYKKIERGFEKTPPIEEKSPRKNYYQVEDVNRLVNKELYNYFCEYASGEIRKRYFDAIKMRNANNEDSRKFLESAEYFDMMKELMEPKRDVHQETIYEQYKEKRIEILFDFITRYFINIDEKLLRADIELLYAEDVVNPYTDVRIALAHERNKDLRNYYSLRKGVEDRM